MSIREREGKKGITYQVYFPYKNELGISCIYRKGGFNTKKEAKAHETLLKAQIAKYGYLTQDCELTLNNVFNDYFETFKKRKVSKATIQNYENIYKNHIKQALGHYKIIKLKYPTLQKYFNECSNLSKGLQENIKKVLNNVFKYACKCCYIENNPISLVDLTGIEPIEKKKTITYQELETIIETMENRNCKDSFRNDSLVISLYIGYYTGLRLCETLALEKSDFDFFNNKIHITKQLDCIGKQIKTLKTTLKQMSKKTNIYFHFHMLRHTFISNLANNGVEPQIAKELARHSDIATTMNIYTHVNEDRQKQAINNVFGSKSVKKVSNISLLTN